MKVVLDKFTFSCKENKRCNILNWWYYIQGKIRYKLYYSKFSGLIREHIEEQISWRILVMDEKCLMDGKCQICGCETTALQMANKSCPKPCYPKMMKRFEWFIYKQNNKITI